MDILNIADRDVFVYKIAEHLQQISNSICPDKDTEFTFSEAIGRLQKCTDYLLNNGFKFELELAGAIELIELFCIDLEDPDVSNIIENNEFTVEIKTEKLWELNRNADSI